MRACPGLAGLLCCTGSLVITLHAIQQSILGHVTSCWMHDLGMCFSCRCVELQPLCAAAHRALGLAAEARGDAAEAARELELALELTLSDEMQQGMCSLSPVMQFALMSLQASLQSRWNCGLVCCTAVT